MWKNRPIKSQDFCVFSADLFIVRQIPHKMSDFFEDSSEDEGDEIIRDKTVNGSNNGIASYSVSDNNKQKQGSSGLKISIQTAPNISAKNSGAYEDDSSDEDLLDGDFDDDESDEDEEDGEGRNSKKKVATGVGIEFCEEWYVYFRLYASTAVATFTVFSHVVMWDSCARYVSFHVYCVFTYFDMGFMCAPI